MNITKKEIKNLLKNLFQILLSLFFEERLIVHSKSFVISDDSAMRDAIIRKKIYFFRSRGIWRLPPLRYPGTSWFREFVRGKLEITLSRVFFSVRKKPGTKKETVKGNSNDF